MPETHELPVEIEVVRLAGDGVRYRFPRRQFAGLRGLASGGIIIGLVVLVFMVFWTLGFAGGFQQAFGPAGLLAGLFAIPGFIAAAGAIGFGLALLRGHGEIEVVDGMVRAIERVGPFRWTRSRAAGDIRRLVVESGNVGTDRASAARSDVTSSKVVVLKAELADGKNFWLTFAYPREWLLALARQLAVDCHADLHEPDAPPIEIEIVDVVTQDLGEVDRWEQPSGSETIYEPLPDELTLNVPARGVWRGSAGLFVFGLLWCGFMLFVTSVALLSNFDGKNQGDKLPWFPFVPIIGIFWAIGVGVVLGGVNMGRRRAGLAVVDGKLMILRTGLFGSKTNQWRLAELKSVRVGPSGMEVNDKPVMELQILPLEGKKFGMLGGRDVAEIEWIATLLRDAVNAASHGPSQAE